MVIFTTVVHVITCFLLVIIVLLQTGKGADMGAVFGGGSSSTLFGSTGAGNLLTKVTTGAAFIFMATSLVLAYTASHRHPATIFDRAAAENLPAAGTAAEGTAETPTAETATGDTATAEYPEQPAAGDTASAVNTEQAAADDTGASEATSGAEAQPDAEPGAPEAPPAEPPAP